MQKQKGKNVKELIYCQKQYQPEDNKETTLNYWKKENKKKNYQVRIQYPLRISIKNEDKIMTFSDIQMLKELNFSRPAL